MALRYLGTFLQVLVVLMVISMPAAARADDRDVQTAWRLLDYIGVDYPEAVSDGQITSPSEYAEQQEFAATVAKKLAELPPNAKRETLIAGAARLREAIDAKSDPKDVAEIAGALAASLLAAYPVPLAPTTAPSFERGAALYGEHCAACHGASGDGKGADASGLNPPPIAFTDAERARQRSIFALYQAITQGIDGTSMPSFDSLPANDRWALAFYAGHFAFPDGAASEGERLWTTDSTLHDLLPDLKSLTGTTPASLAARLGQDNADAVMAYLRRHPEAVVRRQASPLALVRERLGQSLKAYQAGDRHGARELALSAYLDGFEPLEPALATRNGNLMEQIEGKMGEYRAAVERGDEARALADHLQVLNVLFDDAEAALMSGAGSSVSTFLGAATILLREGMEALLIVVAMIAFLRKAERTDLVRHVHAGWVSGLVAGLLTWAAATWMIGISGASRELTEGFGSVFAAVVLLSVGIWMHDKSHADQWQRYIRDKMSKALSGRSAWILFGLAFVAVYREVFETILFYAAIWTQGNGTAMLAGAVAACIALVLIAAAMLRFARRLPIGKFFSYSSWLMAILAIVLAGKGVASLQEAGIVGISPLYSVPRLSLVGIYPTVQTVAAQLMMLGALGMGFLFNRRVAYAR